MKKILIRLIIALVVVVVLGVLVVGLFLDRAIKAGIERAGPRLTGGEVKLESVSLSLFSGRMSLLGLVVGNPPGFQTPSAINLASVSVAIEPRSLLSQKVIIKSINIQAPEITFETDLRANNLSKILSNMQAASGGGAKPPARPTEPAPPAEATPARAARKLQVDDLSITGGKIRVSVTSLGGQAVTVNLPDIHLQALGTGADGITPADLAAKVLDVIQIRATEAAASTLLDIGKGALYIPKDIGKPGSNTLDKVSKGIGNLFKK